MPDVDQIGLDGRIGMHASLSTRVGLFGHIGQVLGSNSSDQGGVKVTWWSSSPEGAVGLSLNF